MGKLESIQKWLYSPHSMDTPIIIVLAVIEIYLLGVMMLSGKETGPYIVDLFVLIPGIVAILVLRIIAEWSYKLQKKRFKKFNHVKLGTLLGWAMYSQFGNNSVFFRALFGSDRRYPRFSSIIDTKHEESERLDLDANNVLRALSLSGMLARRKFSRNELLIWKAYFLISTKRILPQTIINMIISVGLPQAAVFVATKVASQPARQNPLTMWSLTATLGVFYIVFAMILWVYVYYHLDKQASWCREVIDLALNFDTTDIGK